MENKTKITPFGTNILIAPVAKVQILVSDQGTLCEYGKVLAVGDEVQKIKVGDMVGFLVWGIRKLIVEEDTFYFVPEDSRFLLGTLTE